MVNYNIITNTTIVCRVIKLIPITLMAIVGTIVGLSNGTLTTNFTTVVSDTVGSTSGALFAAVVATVFAYEGWIVATSINAELENPKRNLPIALVIGALIVVVAYVIRFSTFCTFSSS